MMFGGKMAADWIGIVHGMTTIHPMECGQFVAPPYLSIVAPFVVCCESVEGKHWYNVLAQAGWIKP
jgi:hypothetical protein